MIIDILFYITAFLAIWLGAGFIISSVDRLARKLKLSSFAISFFILGIMTSIPEMAISATAVAEHNPEIFVGTLLGGTIVIFLLILPVLAILGKGIRINHDLNDKNILLSLTVTAAPGLLVIDHRITNIGGLFLVSLYAFLFYVIQKKHGIFDHAEERVMNLKAYTFLDLIRVILGVGVVFISSQYIVNQTIAFSAQFNVPTFYLSLLLLSVGTNLPELSLAVRAVFSGKKDIAFGDYLGSAAANTLLFGIFTLVNDGEVLTVNNFLVTFLFTVTGLGLFFFFSRSKRDISVTEGMILLFIYILFIIFELGKGVILG